jgi:antitoxin (DNA-binding transcriptional repressor) of toxin-antitoxin stability system
MRTVGLRELKNRLSEYVRHVREGERVLITDRGEVVAELRKPLSSVEPDDPYAALVLLARQGRLRLGGVNSPALYPRLKPLLPPGSAAILLDEQRGER